MIRAGGTADRVMAKDESRQYPTNSLRVLPGSFHIQSLIRILESPSRWNVKRVGLFGPVGSACWSRSFITSYC